MKKNKTVEYGKYGLIFIIPFFLVFIIFQLYPLIYTFYSSLIYSEKSGRITTESFGLGNYTNNVFGKNGSDFWNSLIVTVVLWVMNFIPQVLLAILLAAWFTDIRFKLKGQGAFKVIMYMPNIITAATIAVLFYGLFGIDGPITKICKNLGWVGERGFLDKGWAALIIIAFIQFWMWYGNTMIVLTAGILGINPSLYEAASVDGASSRQQFFRITLPLLKPILQFTLVTSAIGGLQMFDIPQLFNDGGPINVVNGKNVDSTTTVVMLIKKFVTAGNSQDYGKAGAYSVMLFIFTLIISFVFYRLTADKNNDGR
ncbi:MAG: carbohydrate ABC transporter permease [Wujia sp.]